MDEKTLLNHILIVAKAAASNLEPCRSGSAQLSIPDVRVIGEKRLHSLSTLIDSALQKAKKSVIPIFGLEGLFLILLLAIL